MELPAEAGGAVDEGGRRVMSQRAGVSNIKQRVTIPSDGSLNPQGNKLHIMETGDGEIYISISTYEDILNRYVHSGVIRIETGGKKHS